MDQLPATAAQSGNWEQKAIMMMVEHMQLELKTERRWRRIYVVFRVAGFLILLGGLLFTILHKPITEHSHTAFVTISGEIAPGRQSSEDRVVPAIRKAFENKFAKAVILEISSPGGSPVQASRIYQDIVRQKAEHPEKRVYAVIDDIGASGGYYVAVAADEIYADEASMVGSIGVISASFGFTGLMDKLGIERRAITAGEHNDLLDPYVPLNEQTRAYWESLLKDTHRQFIARIQDGRGDRLSDDESLFTGLIWNGAQAIKLGLIDGFGSLSSVAGEVIGEATLVDYTLPVDFLTRLSQKGQVTAQAMLEYALAPRPSF